MLLGCVLFAVVGAVPVNVMMPLDVLNDDGSINNPTQLQGWLKQLAGAGVHGVMQDVWWGYTEPCAKGYNFTAYKNLFNMVQSAGLKVAAVASFHQCGGNVGDACNIPLPSWVVSSASQHSGVWYTDVHGNQDKEYVSLFVDSQSYLCGRTPLQAYQDWLSAFSFAMGNWMGSLIEEVQVGLGPCGELRYPSYQLAHWSFCGIGGMQCYGPDALSNLEAAATAYGHPEWGHAGPNNCGDYDSTPDNTGFWTGGGDNYQSPYGQFFLSWYSNQLYAHGKNVLTRAKAVLPSSVTVAAKVAGLHWWEKHPSHAAECTAGYNVVNGNNMYQMFATMFDQLGVIFDFTCLEMTDYSQPSNCDCGPQELVSETEQAAWNAGAGYAGENALNFYDSGGYSQVESVSSGLRAFTYLRLGSDLMSGGNWSNFANFVQAMRYKN